MYGDCDGSAFNGGSLTVPRNYTLSLGRYCYNKTIVNEFTFDEPFTIKKVIIRDLHITHNRMTGGIASGCFGLPSHNATTTPTTYEYDVNINITSGSRCDFKHYIRRSHRDDENESIKFTLELY